MTPTWQQYVQEVLPGRRACLISTRRRLGLSHLLCPAARNAFFARISVMVVLVAVGMAAACLRGAEPSTFEYSLLQAGQVSAAIYDSGGRLVRTLLTGEKQDSGRYQLTWDGLDRDGRPMPVGQYTWKVLRTPGFRAQYVTSLGINPASAPYERWVGNHGGAASVAVDASGMYAAAQITETAPVLLKQSLDGKTRHWTRGRGDVTRGRYQGGVSLTSDGQGRLFMLQQNGYAQVVDARRGTLLETWDVLPEHLRRKEDGGPTWFIYQHGARVAGIDMDARGETIVVTYRDDDRVRWLNPRDGSVSAEITVARPTGVAVDTRGQVFVISQDRVLRVRPDGQPTPIIKAGLTAPRRLAIDARTDELLIAERSPGCQVKRYSPNGKLLARYGRRGGRRQGTYVAADFRGITDIASDGKGGFVVAELEPAPRRIVHCDRDGNVLSQWYGGQPYYAWGEPDPRDPSRVWFNSGRWLTLAEVDYANDHWRVLETWHIDELADGLVDSRPGHHGRWWIIYHDDRRYLVSQGAPQVLLHQPGSLRPVSVIANRDVERAVEMAGRGTGANSFRWLDRNSDGRPQGTEFTFSDSADIPVANWISPDFAVLQAGSAERDGQVEFVMMQTLPTWRDGLPIYPIGSEPGVKQPVATTPVDTRIGSRGSGAYRDADGNYYGNFNDGRERHGTSWPTVWGGISRLVKWDAEGKERWAVGRHAIHGGLGGAPGSTPPGRLHVPINVIGEVHDTVILADRVETTAMAWARDGLYAGSFFDRRTDDGLPDAVYHWWRTPLGAEAITTSDNAEGGRVIQRADGAVFWFAQGRNSIPVYQIHGWDNWTRLEGTISLDQPPPHARRAGSGLRALFFDSIDPSGPPSEKRIDTQIWHGSPRRAPGNDPVTDGFHHGPVYDWSKGAGVAAANRGFAVRWTGHLEAPLTEPFIFSVYLRGGVRLWIDGRQRVFGWNETNTRWETQPIKLEAGRRYAVQLDFYSTHKHPACSLNWESPSLDRRRIPTELMYPGTVPDIADGPDPRSAASRIDARTFDEQSGEIAAGDVRGAIRGLRQRALGKSGAWLGYRRLDFRQGVSRVLLDASGHAAGRDDFPVTLALRLDGPNGRTIATAMLSNEGPCTARLKESVSGRHDLYIVNTTRESWHFLQLRSFRFE